MERTRATNDVRKSERLRKITAVVLRPPAGASPGSPAEPPHAPADPDRPLPVTTPSGFPLYL